MVMINKSSKLHWSYVISLIRFSYYYYVFFTFIYLVKSQSGKRWKQWQWDIVEHEPASEDEAVPVYHFPMLNDHTRNKAYYDALKVTIVPRESLVLDLGAGFMFLSMVSASFEAQVVAIERNERIAKIGLEIIAYNNLSDHITVIQEESFDIEIDGSLLTKTPDILVSETFDSWIIGEGFLSSLLDLRARKVISDETIVIPSSGLLYIQLVETYFSFPQSATISGFDFEILRPYKTFNHMTLKDFNVRKNLSNVVEAFSFNLQSYRHCEIVESVTFPYPNGILDYRVLFLPITKDGTVHGATFWFDLNLDPAGTITLRYTYDIPSH